MPPLPPFLEIANQRNSRPNEREEIKALQSRICSMFDILLIIFIVDLCPYRHSIDWYFRASEGSGRRTHWFRNPKFPDSSKSFH